MCQHLGTSYLASHAYSSNIQVPCQALVRWEAHEGGWAVALRGVRGGAALDLHSSGHATHDVHEHQGKLGTQSMKKATGEKCHATLSVPGRGILMAKTAAFSVSCNHATFLAGGGGLNAQVDSIRALV